jgi:general secretion pathway protein C
MSVPLNGAASGNLASASRLGEIRNRLKANPSEAVSMNAIQPVMVNGQLKGYQLADNPYMPALREAGLMPGDVVTRVNGIAVTDQARAAEMFNQLSNAGHVDLEVERGGVPTSLSVNLGR